MKKDSRPHFFLKSFSPYLLISFLTPLLVGGSDTYGFIPLFQLYYIFIREVFSYQLLLGMFAIQIVLVSFFAGFIVLLKRYKYFQLTRALSVILMIIAQVYIMSSFILSF